MSNVVKYCVICLALIATLSYIIAIRPGTETDYKKMAGPHVPASDGGRKTSNLIAS